VKTEKSVENEMTHNKARDLDEPVLRTFIKSYSRRYEQWKKNDLLSVALQTLPKQFKKKNVLKCGSFLLIALMFVGILNSISKAYATSVRTQMCIIIDGSSSVSETRWTMIKNGVAEAINNTIPKDGSVELTIVQFGYSASNGSAKTELTPTVVDIGSFSAIIDTVLAMPKSNVSTPMADGIFLGWTELRNSPNFAFSEEQVISLATDGAANIRNNNATSDLDGSGGSPNARDDVVAVVNYAVSQGLNELDVVGVGNVTLNSDWLENWVVRPQPAHLAPPFNPGWFRVVTNSSVFAETLGETFLPGDVNRDRKVSLSDLVLLALAYGSKPGDSNWNLNADIDSNGAVDLPDLTILAQHYGQHYS
jgi:hypothetical protein